MGVIPVIVLSPSRPGSQRLSASLHGRRLFLRAMAVSYPMTLTVVPDLNLIYSSS